MKATKLLAILAIAAILVMGTGTFVVMGGLQGQTLPPSTAQGRMTAYVIPPTTSTSGMMTVNVLPR